MKKYLFALCMLPLFASIYARQKVASLNRSVYSNFRSLPTNREAAEQTRKQVEKVFPGWATYTDKLNGTFTSIVGPAIRLNGSSLSAKATACMKDRLGKLGIKQNEWIEVKSKVAIPYVNYKQVLNGHDVFMSSLKFSFAGNGDILKVSMKNYGNKGISATPKISRDDAKKFALNDLPGVTVTSCNIEANWDWFPLPFKNGYELHPSWRFKIIGKQNATPAILWGYIDALNGDLLYRSNDVKTDFNVTVKGTVYKNGTLQPATLEPLANLQMDINANTYYTDNLGYYNTTSLNVPQSPLVNLSGKWSSVVDYNTFTTPVFTDIVNVNNTTYNFPALAPSSSRHVNAYYHTNRVHDYFKQYFPAFTSLDFPLITNVDDNSDVCNAFYDGSSINFYAAGGGCNSFAELGDVVYHEYGHGISDHVYTDITGWGMNNSSQNEGNSDVWALSITHSPVMALNAFTPEGGFIRRYDMTPQLYPMDWVNQGDPHYNGQILVGAWWDAGINIGNFDTMARLFTSVYYSTPDGFDGDEGILYRDVLMDALLADDNDNNLANGTPHYHQITAAFVKHGISLAGDVILDHTELSNQPAGTPIPVAATFVTGAPTNFAKLMLYYKKGTATAWDSVTMASANSIDYTGTIPAQSAGSVIRYYFAMVDPYGEPNGYFPPAFNPITPATQTSIPYQFAVGVTAKDSTDFETPAPAGWLIGNNPGDNAVTGTWLQDWPTNNGFPWPAGDHTSGLGRCLFTGNTASGDDVDQGTTTILSPVFDISTFVKPIIQYHRWFSNDMGENFKNDPWQVLIKDASNNNWVNVEKTYQSDLSWRKRIFAVNEFLPAGTTHIQMKFAISDSMLSNWENEGQSLTIGGMDDFFLYDATAPEHVANVSAMKAEIYPNPADGLLSVSLASTDNNGFISIQDVTGKEVSRTGLIAGTSKYSINTQSITAGTYIVVVQNNKTIQSQKITLKHN